jgi:uncharacterized membrane protein YkoI
MNNRQIKEKLYHAFTENAPHGLDLTQISQSTERTGEMIMMKNNKKNRVRGLVAMAAAVAVVLTAGITFGAYRVNGLTDSMISLDVNPGIEIELNRNQKVLAVTPLNDDARVVVGNMDFKGSSLEVTVNALVGSLLQNGYLNDLSNSILVSVENDNPQKSAQLQADVSAMVDSLLHTETFNGAVVTQQMAKSEEITQLKETYGITEGKAGLIQNISKANTAYKQEELAELSINELNLLLHRKDTTPQQVTMVGEASDKAYIGEQKAKEIALTHAKVTENNLTDFEIEMDYEKGIMVYEVDFDFNHFEYEYEINALTGEIIRSKDNEDIDHEDDFDDDRDDRDDDDFDDDFDDDDDDDRDDKKEQVQKPAQSKPQQQKPTENSVAQKEPAKDNKPNKQPQEESVVSKPTTSLLTKEKVKEIVLAHAGLKAEDLRGYQIELDKDDGVEHYEIEFRAGKYEFEYDVNAKTGSIMQWDKEIDD